MNKTLEKLILWFKSAGLRSLGYLGAAVAAKVLLGSQLLFGAGLGIFVADNWVTIKELVINTVEDIKAK